MQCQSQSHQASQVKPHQQINEQMLDHSSRVIQ